MVCPLDFSASITIHAPLIKYNNDDWNGHPNVPTKWFVMQGRLSRVGQVGHGPRNISLMHTRSRSTQLCADCAYIEVGQK